MPFIERPRMERFHFLPYQKFLLLERGLHRKFASIITSSKQAPQVRLHSAPINNLWADGLRLQDK